MRILRYYKNLTNIVVVAAVVVVIVAVTSDDFRMSSRKIWREIENYTTAQLKYITRVYNNRFTKQRETR